MNFFKASVLGAVSAAVLAGSAMARDDGRYAGSPLKPWFDTLKSGKGLCCSDADGFAVSDPDWESKDGRYRVRLEGEWIMVPDDAISRSQIAPVERWSCRSKACWGFQSAASCPAG